MFATSDRVRPWSARWSERSVGREITIVSPAWAMPMSGDTVCSSEPLGPLIVIRPGDVDTSTPAGTWMGRRPIRLMTSPHEREHLAADALLRGIRGGAHAGRGGDDRAAEAAQHARQAVLRRVDAAARLRDALQARDHALAVRAVLQLDDEQVDGLALLHVVRGDVALVVEDAGDLELLLRDGHARDLRERRVGVADAGQHVGDGI